jgi:hypothetical protein
MVKVWVGCDGVVEGTDTTGRWLVGAGGREGGGEGCMWDPTSNPMKMRTPTAPTPPAMAAATLATLRLLVAVMLLGTGSSPKSSMMFSATQPALFR